MKFERELFISYAHIDDQPLVEGRSGWVSDFHRVLEIRLSQLLGQQVKVWRDPELRGNEDFARTLVERVRSVGLLISVLSPRYVRSEWCMREVEQFVESAESTGGLTVADGNRLFKVVKTAIPLESQPPVLRSMLGYDFYKLDPQSGRPVELSQRPGSEAEQDYWARLEDLAYDVHAQLEALLGRGASADPESVAAPAGGKTVFLAESTSDISSERDRLRRELLQQGHRVLPDRVLPLVAAPLEEAVREFLNEADLAVHPVGAYYGVVPEGGSESIAEMQNRLSVEVAGERRLPRVVWIPPGLEAVESKQAEFVRRLESDAETQGGADVVRSLLEHLKAELEAKLAAQEPEVQAAASEQTRIYVVGQEDDLEGHQAALDHLHDAGFELILPAFEGDPSALHRDHIDSLVFCSAVLILYGQADELWLRAKLRDLAKAPGYGRESPFRATAVYVAPPETAAKKRFRTHEARVLRAGEEFDAGILRPFLDDLESGGRVK
jgi:hypothetical protein